jgi:hypothetical protein
MALAAWRTAHLIRLRNKKTRVRIPPGYKVFRDFMVFSTHKMHCLRVEKYFRVFSIKLLSMHCMRVEKEK